MVYPAFILAAKRGGILPCFERSKKIIFTEHPAAVYENK